MADWAARSSAHRYGKIKCDAGHEEELRRAATATARTARLRAQQGRADAAGLAGDMLSFTSRCSAASWG